MNSEAEYRESLEQTAALALEFGGLLMESGATAHRVEESTTDVAIGLGAEVVDILVGYESISISISVGSTVLTRIRKLGRIGVDQRLHQSLIEAAAKIKECRLTFVDARLELDSLIRASTHYPTWVVAVSVGIACAAFGRLLGVDWASVGPVFFAATFGQLLRRKLHSANVFLTTLIVAFFGSALCGLTCRWTGSLTILPAMVATVLLLIPGIPAFNAQFDILEGRPTLGSARAVSVAMILLYMTLGIWLAQGLIIEGR
jgi:uncharacterized membrane protein YjjP (DUF1212 family)